MPKRKSPHSTVQQGKRVLVRLKDGTYFVDKFRRNEKGCIHFDDHLILRADLEMMTIYREMSDGARDARNRNNFIKGVIETLHDGGKSKVIKITKARRSR